MLKTYFLYYNLIGDTMKKIIITLILCLLLTGCQKKEKEIPKEIPKTEPEETVVKDTYKDLNNTPIGIYKLENNTLTKLSTMTKHLNVEEDIGTFQIFLSNENTVTLNNNFGEAFYNEWIKYKNIKQGFNIKYTLKNGETTSYNILSPKETFDHWEYLMNYLYDDYINRGKSFYSHLETSDYNSNSLFTAIKIQAAYKCSEIKNIELTAFTYDSEDDFLDKEYRGNSSSKLIINTN